MGSSVEPKTIAAVKFGVELAVPRQEGSLQQVHHYCLLGYLRMALLWLLLC